ncbi:T9SS type A sorting domain-containing protein [Ancylomarina sp. 16SWW S1-10-2]|uniref:T9SS type A sorting domain-containing protein n=1 Tax=Ancylomarina sp. 16SWW S1-10-2 TaxID=2499681 RepID=UPI0012ADDADC|nr:T9SS type A sorting domain-containing protein [Ancylomarina sp. 16SWW S1-10-2]MRT93186.1 T9SS type A sorting domain-containing protein [Ancylomarina sp. 16SWW S1-10-2]
MMNSNKYITVLIGFILTLSILGTHDTQAQESDLNRTQVPFSTNKQNFTVWNGENYVPFFIKGVNLGVAIPGTFPGELAASKNQYSRWIEDIHDVGFNCIRIYTLHYPRFYEALKEFNDANPASPMYIMQGVWLEEEQSGYTNDLYQLNDVFNLEAKDMLDCIHGNNTIEHRFGKAYGSYTVDVSPWVMSYIIGREINPSEIKETNDQHPNQTSFSGTVFNLERGSPSEVWATSHLEYLVTYERNNYNTERPVSISSWPTLDPLTHPTETGTDEDKESLDLSNLNFDGAPAGYFASFHAYPYYPDFISKDPSYKQYYDPLGQNSYLGYISDLKNYYKDIPVLIAEVGTPSSWGVAHYASSGMNHGGASEIEQGLNTLRLLDNIEEAGCAGGIQFSWIDEWFKRTWITDAFDFNPEARILWHNVTAAEQNFGLIAFRPLETIYTELEDFGTNKPIKKILTAADFDFLNIRLMLKNELSNIDTIWMAIDTYNSNLGESILPSGTTITNRAEFALRITNYSAELFVTQAYDLYGLWHGVSESTQLYHSTVTDGAPWNLVRWKNNDSNYEIQYVGNLKTRRTELSPSSLDAVIISNDSIDIHLPWSLIQVTDPANAKVMDDDRATDETEEAISDGIALSILHNDVLQEGNNRFNWSWGAPSNYVEVKKRSYYVVKDGLVKFNNEPIAYTDFYTTNQDERLLVEADKGLLTNDFDFDGNSFYSELSEFCENGFVFLSEDGSFEYIPDTGFSGQDYFSYRAFDDGGHSIKTKVTINVATITSIDDFEEELAVTIYPNPVSQFLRINLSFNKQTQIRIINLKGSIIYQKQISNSQHIIDVHSFPKGVYLLNIQTSKDLISKKIIVN